jgi:2,3-bisphosphoglycerate-dependent phosphoglycerate mutase
VQQRNIAALADVLDRYDGRNIAVGTHGCALSTIINYYDKAYGIKEVTDMLGKMPWAVTMTFNGKQCVGIEYTDIVF